MVVDVLVILTLVVIVVLGCAWTLRAFRRAWQAAHLWQATREGVLYFYPRQRDGRDRDVYHYPLFGRPALTASRPRQHP